MTETAVRNADLKQMLSDRRRQLQNEIHDRRRNGRTDRSVDGDDLERSDADFQGDIDLALLQLRTETLARIDAALVRLDSGKYGFCLECEDAIAVRRLRALPFAVRCQSCEEAREQAQGLARQADRQTDPLSRFPPVLGS